MTSFTSPAVRSAPSCTSVVATNAAAVFASASCPACVSAEAVFFAKQKANNTRSSLGRR